MIENVVAHSVAEAYLAVQPKPLCDIGLALATPCGQRRQSLGLLQTCRQSLLPPGAVAAVPVPKDALFVPHTPGQRRR